MAIKQCYLACEIVTALFDELKYVLFCLVIVVHYLALHHAVFEIIFKESRAINIIPILTTV